MNNCMGCDEIPYNTSPVTQWSEYRSYTIYCMLRKAGVVGSIPTGTTFKYNFIIFKNMFLI